MPDFILEAAAAKAGRPRVAGIDEAGRGPLAGPVVAAAVILERRSLSRDLRHGLADSKTLRQPQRERLYAALYRAEDIEIGIGRAEVAEIDAGNILRATMFAMARAVRQLGVRPDVALVDGNHAPALGCPVQCVVGGDKRSLSIAAASIVAKVWRDRIMAGLARAIPGYGWERNAGYGTPEHLDALERLGVTPHHRRSFRPVTDMSSRR